MFDAELKEFFITIVLLSIVPLAISSCVGFLVALLQAATQIQEQTIAFTIRFLTICGVLTFAARCGFLIVIRFFENAIQSIAALGKVGL